MIWGERVCGRRERKRRRRRRGERRDFYGRLIGTREKKIMLIIICEFLCVLTKSNHFGRLRLVPIGVALVGDCFESFDYETLYDVSYNFKMNPTESNLIIKIKIKTIMDFIHSISAIYIEEERRGSNNGLSILFFKLQH